VLEPGVHLRAGTVIGSNCRIGVGSVVTACTLADRVTLHPYTVAERAVFEADTAAGPFTRLREGTTICSGAKTGNFVELKKTTLGPGSKASHLAYLGDATIGEGVNIGAGTITCNYDGGPVKHATQIGREAFIGSNSTLVAPLQIGPRAYVGAGSTVTRDVPVDALAIARARQENRPGYARRLRARLKQGGR